MCIFVLVSPHGVSISFTHPKQMLSYIDSVFQIYLTSFSKNQNSNFRGFTAVDSFTAIASVYWGQNKRTISDQNNLLFTNEATANLEQQKHTA